MKTGKDDAKRWPWLLIAGGLVLILAVGAVVRSLHSTPVVPAGAVARPPAILALEEFHPPGWTVETLPLGETELLRQKVQETLNFDHAAFVRFRRGEREFSLYIAYWSPGRVTAREVRHHTPDTCWVQSGWEEKARDDTCRVSSGILKTVIGQGRTYTQRDYVQHVQFWHLMNGRLVPHWTYGQPTPLHILGAILGDAHAVRGEQFFVRISSPAPLEWLWQEPVGEQLLHMLAPIGILSGEKANK